jgi:hypothetical protein
MFPVASYLVLALNENVQDILTDLVVVLVQELVHLLETSIINPDLNKHLLAWSLQETVLVSAGLILGQWPLLNNYIIILL